MRYKHFCVVLSGSSGVGKSTISRRILEYDKDLALSVSYTTRPRKEGEIEGVHYFYTNEEGFAKLMAEGKLLEWTHIYGHYYGTARHTITSFFRKGFDLVLDIDFTGALSFKKAFGAGAILIYLLPPSFKELKRRLEKRKRDSKKEIEKRFDLSKEELEYFPRFKYYVVNDDLDEATQQVLSIINAERLRVNRIKKLIIPSE
jgi:guanylate kinase